MISRGFKFLVVAYVLSVGFYSQGACAGAWANYNAKIAPLFEAANARLDRSHHPSEVTELGFTVELKQSGEVREVVIITPSGSDVLDSAAVQSALDLSPLPTPPASVFFRQFFTPLTIRYKFHPKKEIAQNPVKRIRQSEDEKKSKVQKPDTRSKSKPPRNDLVRSVQVELTRLGFDSGPVDGYFGRKTETAIKNFQRHDGLTVDGRPSKALLQILKTYDIQRLSSEISAAKQENATSRDRSDKPVLAAQDRKSTQRFYEDYEYIDPSVPKVYEDYEFIAQ